MIDAINYIIQAIQALLTNVGQWTLINDDTGVINMYQTLFVYVVILALMYVLNGVLTGGKK